MLNTLKTAILNRVFLAALWCLCVLADVITLVWMLLAIVSLHKRALHIAFGKDQTANAAIGGHWDETISSRAWRNRNKNKRWYTAHKFIDALFWFDPNHCQNSHFNEIKEANIWLKGLNE